jgi:hypothetical protein
MKLKTVLKILLTRFREKNIEIVLSGGLALSTMGVFRFTKDIDFIVSETDRDRLDAVMVDLGYRKQDFSSDEIVSYISEARALGQVDFLVARRRYTKAMIQNAEARPVFDGELTVKTLQPEDLIGLKVQALYNDPDNRTLVDAPDIQRLLRLHRKRLDLNKVREYFQIFQMESLLEEWLRDAE